MVPHTPNTRPKASSSPHPPERGFWAVWRLSFAPSELCSQLKNPVRGGEMGWGEAVAYHRKRLEDEQRARVASWEAGAGSKRPAPTGVARNLENSFCTSMHVRHQTPGSSSSSYQGKMWPAPLQRAHCLPSAALDNHVPCPPGACVC